jgi:hypothetical protein
MSPRRSATLATLLALALSAALAGPALAAPIAIPGAPLTVYVDQLGQLQAKRDNGPNNIFYSSVPTATRKPGAVDARGTPRSRWRSIGMSIGRVHPLLKEPPSALALIRA